MKTTVDLPPELLRRVKVQAAIEGSSIKELLIEALRQRLATNRPSHPVGWRAVFGRAKRPEVRDVDRRLSELEQIAPEDWR